MSSPSTPQKARASVFIHRLQAAGGLSLTNETKCRIIRSDLNTTRSQFDEIVEYLYVNNFVKIDLSGGSAWLTLTPDGKNIADGRKDLFKKTI